MTPSILWLRQDLRLQDQPALVAAAAEGAVIPVYVLDDETPGKWRIGGASRWWLHHSLAALAKALEAKGSRLILRRGRTAEVLAALADETGAATIHANRHHEPWWVEAEEALGDRLCRHDGNHLAPLREIVTGSGGQYRVYSAFWRALGQRMPPADPLPVPRQIPAPAHWPKSDRLADWDLLPTKPDWSKGFADWEPGEVTALRRADEFVDEVVDYEARRDLPDVEGTSRLSPHLHFGEISPRMLWHTLDGARNAEKFRKEMAWRDFAASLLLALPDYGDTNGRPAFDAMKWRRSPSDLKAWQQGRTGYPIVDAGMRQLWVTGWMHNRVRMITASFLIKHLLIDWREGERWFWDTLVDADYGNNSVNWQWVAGTGVDSNMWGRIMAPLVQSEKFDAAGYIREWVPELRDLGDADIHDPVFRPKDYPDKIIGHREARERALAAGRALR
ncbi:MAG: deoxyribodipyrimidine photo-lyase [Sphingomonas sp.]